MEESLSQILARAGGMNAMARALGITSASVAGWKRVPAARVAEVSRITGLPAARIRPDLAGFSESQAVFGEAWEMGLDPAAILAEAVRAEKTRRWQAENAAAIAAQHEWVEKNELPLAKYRMFALPEPHGEV